MCWHLSWFGEACVSGAGSRVWVTCSVVYGPRSVQRKGDRTAGRCGDVAPQQDGAMKTHPCGFSGEVGRYRSGSRSLELGGNEHPACSAHSPLLAFTSCLGFLTLLLLLALSHPQPEFMSFSHSSMLFNPVPISPLLLAEGTLAHLDPASHSLAPNPITMSQLDALTPHLPLLCGQKGPVVQESCWLWRISQSLASSVDMGLGRRRPLEDITGPSAWTLYCPHGCGWGPSCWSSQYHSISGTA